jgi:hypothetical protein
VITIGSSLTEAALPSTGELTQVLRRGLLAGPEVEGPGINTVDQIDVAADDLRTLHTPADLVRPMAFPRLAIKSRKLIR